MPPDGNDPCTSCCGMTEALVVVAHIVDVIDQLRADDAVPPHCECDVGAAVLESGSRILDPGVAGPGGKV